MEEKRICAHCGNALGANEGLEIDEDILCDNCRDMLTTTCRCCGEAIWDEDAICDSYISLCQDCFDEHYHRCECCDRIVHEDQTMWRNDLSYCPACYDGLDDEIENYNYKPDPIMYGNGNRFFGVELEVDFGGKDDDNACALKFIANAHGEHIYIKGDGSLDDGFEIVSHPMTLDYHYNQMNWEAVMQKAIDMDYRSHQTDTCGLHIHVNRNAFGDNQMQQEEVISRILFFVEKHWAELFRFSRRSSYNMERWAARLGFEKTGKEILEKAKDKCNRYVAVNLNNYKTIEFRLFRGTLKWNTFIATLQMVNHICDVALLLSEREMDEMSWSEFVGKITEPELITYLKERQLYINEEVFGEEEI